MSNVKNLWLAQLAVAAVLILQCTSVEAKKPPKPDEPDDTTLPNMKYQIKVLPLLEGSSGHSAEGISGPIEIDGQWHVQAVGGFAHTDGYMHAVLYDPTRDTAELIDMNNEFPDMVSAIAYDISSDSNGKGVVVGAMRNAVDIVQGFAVDLAIDPPVLDLLPTGGSTYSSAIKVNENGDILIAFDDRPEPGSQFFVFNPGIYSGDPAIRAQRTEAIDFTNEDVSDMVFPKTGDPDIEGARYNLFINNPIQITPEVARPAQVLTTTSWDASPDLPPFPVRYTLGLGPEVFDFRAYVSAINDDGSFCGLAATKVTKKNYTAVPFRYDDAGGLQLVPGVNRFHDYPHDMNAQGDLLTRKQVYRDDWGDWISVDDLVVGDPADLTLWAEDPQGFLLWPYISDRIPIEGSEETAGIIVGGRSGHLVILTPVAN